LGDVLKSTKFWVILFAAVLLLSGAAAVHVFHGKTQGATANIYQDGVCLYSIDLSKVEEGYALEITGDTGIVNTVAVEPGRICVQDATCPDQVCVHQGWISNGVAPVVCLPNALVIKIENAPDADIDAVVR